MTHVHNESVLTLIENASVLTTIDRIDNSQRNDNQMNENAYPRTETIISNFQNESVLT